MVVELEVQLVVAGVAGLDVQGALAEAVCLAAVAAMPPPDAPADGHGVVEDSDDASGESCLMEEGRSEEYDYIVCWVGPLRIIAVVNPWVYKIAQTFS